MNLTNHVPEPSWWISDSDTPNDPSTALHDMKDLPTSHRAIVLEILKDVARCSVNTGEGSSYDDKSTLASNVVNPEKVMPIAWRQLRADGTANRWNHTYVIEVDYVYADECNGEQSIAKMGYGYNPKSGEWECYVS